MPMETFEANIADAETLFSYSRALGNQRTRRMRKELRQRVGEALRVSKKERSELDCIESDDGYVFAKPDGSPIHPDLISRTFQRFMTQIDLPRIRLHDLRHTHATILLQENIHPKVVSERLGHSSIAFTMTVYQHVMPGMQAEAAATFGAAVFGESCYT